MSTASAAGTTFAVSDVARATSPLMEVPYLQAVSQYLGVRVEACSKFEGTLLRPEWFVPHALITALRHSFASHRPATLSPDIIWLTICQGFALHINQNADTLRHLLVRHDGKINLRVRRDDFVKGSRHNPWPEVFAEFSNAIREHAGDVHRLVVADFSTTGPVERAASELVLLDSLQKFFDYSFITICGIPSITLEGTPEDWRMIANRVGGFACFDLAWWIEHLQPVVEQFVAAPSGHVDADFWRSFFTYDGSSGSQQVTGWVLRLFPYLSNPDAYRPRTLAASPLRRNPWLTKSPGRSGPAQSEFPGTVGRVPFRWQYLDHDYPMEFLGGLVGVAQDPVTLALRPEIGWAVAAETTEG
jgi:hypothetical protein